MDEAGLFKEASELLAARRYHDLKARLATADPGDLMGIWPLLGPLEKLCLFKLLDPSRAMDFFARLEFDERYFLFCGFPLNSIAPILEASPGEDSRLFVQLPAAAEKRMLRELSA